eukprot:UN02253
MYIASAHIPTTLTLIRPFPHEDSTAPHLQFPLIIPNVQFDNRDQPAINSNGEFQIQTHRKSHHRGPSIKRRKRLMDLI